MMIHSLKTFASLLLKQAGGGKTEKKKDYCEAFSNTSKHNTFQGDYNQNA